MKNGKVLVNPEEHQNRPGWRSEGWQEVYAEYDDHEHEVRQRPRHHVGFAPEVDISQKTIISMGKVRYGLTLGCAAKTASVDSAPSNFRQ